MNKPADFEDYASSFPGAARAKLEQIREVIHNAAPTANEMISYGMPAFKLHKMLVYFATYGKHIGFYPGPSGIKAFASKLSGYKTSKGAIQFPLNTPLPLGLIEEIVHFRVAENSRMAQIKK